MAGAAPSSYQSAAANIARDRAWQEGILPLPIYTAPLIDFGARMNLEIPCVPPAQDSADVARLEKGGLELIEGYSEEWAALCGRSARDEPFYRPEWILAYLRAFAPDASVVLLTIRRAGHLIALLPLLKETHALGGMPTRKLRSAGNTHTCRFDLLHEAGTTEAVIPCLWATLVAEPGWDVLEIGDALEDSALMQLAEHARRSGYAVHFVPGLTPPYLDLEGFENHDALLQHLEAKFRANLRRRDRKLAERGSVSLRREEIAGSMLAHFYALERSGWKGVEGSAIDCAPSTRAFYDEIARGAERCGYLAMYALGVAGKPAAMFFGLEYNARYYLLKTAYDETLRDASPGQLLTERVLRVCVERGCAEFDFLGGDMAWKRDWLPRQRHLTDIFVYRGVAGRALRMLRFRLRPAVARAVRWIHPRSS